MLNDEEGEFKFFLFIFVVKNSYNKVKFVQKNFTKLFLRESVSLDQFSRSYNSFNMSSLLLLVHYKLFILEKYIKNRIRMSLVYIAHSIKLK